jgi:hypothetical protein
VTLSRVLRGVSVSIFALKASGVVNGAYIALPV